MKNEKQLEKHFKGIANHRRISILLLISNSEGISLDGIAQVLNCNFKTISAHVQKLHNAGLINKKNNWKTVGHSLSPYGKIFVKFIKSFASV